MGLIACLLVTFFLPETSHTRGIDLIREERARVLAARSDEEIASAAMASISIWDRRKDVVLINPLATLRILVNPHILAMSLNSAFVLMSVYAILVPVCHSSASVPPFPAYIDACFPSLLSRRLRLIARLHSRASIQHYQCSYSGMPLPCFRLRQHLSHSIHWSLRRLCSPSLCLPRWDLSARTSALRSSHRIRTHPPARSACSRMDH